MYKAVATGVPAESFPAATTRFAGISPEQEEDDGGRNELGHRKCYAVAGVVASCESEKILPELPRKRWNEWLPRN